jgi:hypothetical protein
VPLGGHLDPAPEVEPAEAAGLLGLTEDRLDDRLVPAVLGAALLRGELAGHPLAAGQAGRDPAPGSARQLGAVVIAAGRDIGVDAAFLEVGEIVVGGVAGVGQELARAAPGVRLDLVDQGGGS